MTVITRLVMWSVVALALLGMQPSQEQPMAFETEVQAGAGQDPVIQNVSGGFDPLSITLLAEINSKRFNVGLELLAWWPEDYLLALDLALAIAHDYVVDLDVCESLWFDSSLEGVTDRWWKADAGGLKCVDIDRAGLVALYYNNTYLFYFVSSFKGE